MNQHKPADRSATRCRKSAETAIQASLNLAQGGRISVKTGFGMLDHMLELLFFWADIEASITCEGDMEVDAHHTVEDTGIVLGETLKEALGDCAGIERAGFGRVPMDEALAEVSLDISGRPWLEWRGDELLPPIIAKEEKDVWREFFKALATGARMNIHVTFLYGKNGHHLLESAFKGTGLALKQAIAHNGSKIRSTKGFLDQ